MKPINPITRLLATTFLSVALGASVFAASQSYSVAKSTTSSVEFNFRVTLIPVPGKVNDLKAALQRLAPRGLH